MNSLARDTTIAVGRASRMPLARLRDALSNVAARLRTRWQNAWLDDDTRWLAGAVDHADLERRERALERGDWPRREPSDSVNRP